MSTHKELKLKLERERQDEVAYPFKFESEALFHIIGLKHAP